MRGIEPLAFIPQAHFMQKAIELAQEAASTGEIPVGAVIEKDGIIIGTGRNRREEKQNALCHAEIEAIQAACQTLGTWRLSGCRLYVTLTPCVMCAGAILNARLEQVIYGAEDDKLAQNALEVFQDSGLGTVPFYRHFMQQECMAVLKTFFNTVRE